MIREPAAGGTHTVSRSETAECSETPTGAVPSVPQGQTVRGGGEERTDNDPWAEDGARGAPFTTRRRRPASPLSEPSPHRPGDALLQCEVRLQKPKHGSSRCRRPTTAAPAAKGGGRGGRSTPNAGGACAAGVSEKEAGQWRATARRLGASRRAEVARRGALRRGLACAAQPMLAVAEGERRVLTRWAARGGDAAVLRFPAPAQRTPETAL